MFIYTYMYIDTVAILARATQKFPANPIRPTRAGVLELRSMASKMPPEETPRKRSRAASAEPKEEDHDADGSDSSETLPPFRRDPNVVPPRAPTWTQLNDELTMAFEDMRRAHLASACAAARAADACSGNPRRPCIVRQAGVNCPTCTGVWTSAIEPVPSACNLIRVGDPEPGKGKDKGAASSAHTTPQAPPSTTPLIPESVRPPFHLPLRAMNLRRCGTVAEDLGENNPGH